MIDLCLTASRSYTMSKFYSAVVTNLCSYYNVDKISSMSYTWQDKNDFSPACYYKTICTLSTLVEHLLRATKEGLDFHHYVQ